MKLLPAIRELHKLIPPPPNPVYGGTDTEWSQLEVILQRQLPADFRQLMQTYGLGQFEYEFSFFQPFVNDIEVDGILVPSLIHYNMNYKEIVLKKDGPDLSYRVDNIVDTQNCIKSHLAVWPEEDSVFWLAHHSSNFEIAYRAKGPADTWKVLISTGPHQFHEYPLNLTEFILSRLHNDNDGILFLFPGKPPGPKVYRD